LLRQGGGPYSSQRMYNLEEEARRRERVLLVGSGPRSERGELIESLEELAMLSETAGAEVVEKILHIREKPDAATMIGKGKAREVERIRQELGVDTVIFDQELSPAHIRNLETIIGGKILDRAELILDIFALHAKSREAKIEVELAQYQYLLPRLTGKGIDLSRLGGGIGTRGPGEKKLEVERRRLRERMKRLKDDLESVEKSRQVQRKRRRSMFRIALTGYTNAGKSTVMNALTRAGVKTERALFTTLDPTTRVLQFRNGRKALVTDTVGFIRKLPHHLVASFKSTLEEAIEADLRLRIIDVSHPEFESHLEAGGAVLHSLGCLDKRSILVFNKIDRLLDREIVTGLSRRHSGSIFVSALNGDGMEELLTGIEYEMEREMVEAEFRLPLENARLSSMIHDLGEVLTSSYDGGQIDLRARMHKSDFERMKKLALEAGGEVVEGLQ
jgi:GTP-binding protein HflX